MTDIVTHEPTAPEIEQPSFAFLNDTFFFAHDWSITPVGHPAGWEPQLRSCVTFMLASPQPMLIVWGQERTFLFNDAFRSIVGRHSGRALGASLPDLWAGAWSAIGGLLDDAFKGGTGVVDERPLLTWASDFTEFEYFTFSYSPIHDAAGEIAGASCLLTNTTATMQSKEALRRERDALHVLFELAPSFMAMVQGPEHRFTFANAAYHRLIGRTAILGSTMAEVLPELAEQGVIETFDTVYKSGAPFIDYDFSIEINKGGAPSRTRVHLEIVCQPLIDINGTVTGLFIEGQDVSERYSARERITVLQNELGLASRVNAMATMASTLAHELNQPLTVIHSYMSAAHSIAQRQVVDPRLLECYAGSRDAALRAGEIIRRLRDMTAYGYIKKSHLDLEIIVGDALRLFTTDHPQMRIRTDFRSKSPVSGDRIQIQQILFNLVRNACEATAADNCEVTITTCDKGPLVEVCVTDDGPGISPEILATMFEPFNTTKPEGMGVGLSICRTIIEAHGGTISARNNARGGASICFTLDRA